MKTPHTVWIHPASFTYRLDVPETILETIWVHRPGWGYLKRRDMWIQREGTPEAISKEGFVRRGSPEDPDVRKCPACGMHIESVPGSLVSTHIAQCRGRDDEWAKIEKRLINDQRRRLHEEKVLAEIERAKAEQKEKERKERFGKIRDQALASQLQKDRKRRLKEETRRNLRNK